MKYFQILSTSGRIDFMDEKEREEFEKAKEKALRARFLYNTGQITFKEAEEMMEDFKQIFNKRSAEIAKKYNQKPQKFSVKMFIRYGR